MGVKTYVAHEWVSIYAMRLRGEGDGSTESVITKKYLDSTIAQYSLFSPGSSA